LGSYLVIATRTDLLVNNSNYFICLVPLVKALTVKNVVTICYYN